MTFTKENDKPHLKIYSKQDSENVTIFFEDKGIGIKDEHKNKIFKIFERLHSTETYPGTGIGLAIVKKAVENMGGTLGVESDLGKGSKFWITLKTE